MSSYVIDEMEKNEILFFKKVENMISKKDWWSEDIGLWIDDERDADCGGG